MSDAYLPPADDPFAPPPRPRDQLSGHEYDGIQEYDNPTPAWWTAMFAASVMFALFYFVFYHSGVPERSVHDSYDQAVADDARKLLARLGIGDTTPTQANMLQWMTNKQYMTYGQSVFKANCVSCHGSSAEGLVGPNLTDNYYKNIKKLTDIPRVITEGRANGAMPAWGARLGETDVSLVAAYVATLRGQNLPGRDHEGDEIAPWPPLPAATQPAAK